MHPTSKVILLQIGIRKHCIFFFFFFFFCTTSSQALSSKYFQVGQNLNTSSQVTNVPRPSQPVAASGSLLSRNRQQSVNQSSSVSSGSNKLNEVKPSESKDKLISRRGSKDSWSVESVSPAPILPPKGNVRRRSDWKAAPKQSVQEDKLPWEGKKRQLGSIRESPVADLHRTSRETVQTKGTVQSKSSVLSKGTTVQSRGTVQTKKTQDLVDLDTILSEFDYVSSKKENDHGSSKKERSSTKETREFDYGSSKKETREFNYGSSKKETREFDHGSSKKETREFNYGSSKKETR